MLTENFLDTTIPISPADRIIKHTGEALYPTVPKISTPGLTTNPMTDLVPFVS